MTKKTAILTRLFGLSCLLLLVFVLSEARADDPECSPIQAPHLLLKTPLGEIGIVLFEDAAPDAVARLALAPGDSESKRHALTFDYTRARVEVRTSEPLSEGLDFATQIDARALGLHAQGPRDVGEAMTVMQRELLAAFRRNKRDESLSPQLMAWLKTWFESHDAKFLVGVSRKEINEALGFHYTDGLASRPVTRGSVALVPHDPMTASPRLSIALQDLPRRTGRWMVVGEVVSGLDLANRISIAPLVQPRNVKPSSYAPRDPIVIESVVRACR